MGEQLEAFAIDRRFGELSKVPYLYILRLDVEEKLWLSACEKRAVEVRLGVLADDEVQRTVDVADVRVVAHGYVPRIG